MKMIMGSFTEAVSSSWKTLMIINCILKHYITLSSLCSLLSVCAAVGNRFVSISEYNHSVELLFQNLYLT